MATILESEMEDKQLKLLHLQSVLFQTLRSLIKMPNAVR